jgi:hypothetical protein
MDDQIPTLEPASPTSIPTWKSNMKALLKNLESEGDFAIAVQLNYSVLPALFLRCAKCGSVPLPLPQTLAEQLLSHDCGSGTTSSRVWKADQVEIRNPFWQEDILGPLLRQLKHELGFYAVECELQLSHLALYGPGETREIPASINYEKGKFAQVVVQLPTEYVGGEISVRFEKETKFFKFAAKSRWIPCILGYYSNCKVEMAPITQGYRVCLFYDVALVKLTPPQEIPPTPYLAYDLHVLSKEFKTWLAHPSMDPVVIPCEEKYPLKLGYSASLLQKRDRAVGQILQRIAAKLQGINLYICNVQIETNTPGKLEAVLINPILIAGADMISHEKLKNFSSSDFLTEAPTHVENVFLMWKSKDTFKFLLQHVPDEDMLPWLKKIFGKEPHYCAVELALTMLQRAVFSLDLWDMVVQMPLEVIETFIGTSAIESTLLPRIVPLFERLSDSECIRLFLKLLPKTLFPALNVIQTVAKQSRKKLVADLCSSYLAISDRVAVSVVDIFVCFQNVGCKRSATELLMKQMLPSPFVPTFAQLDPLRKVVSIKILLLENLFAKCGPPFLENPGAKALQKQLIDVVKDMLAIIPIVDRVKPLALPWKPSCTCATCLALLSWASNPKESTLLLKYQGNSSITQEHYFYDIPYFTYTPIQNRGLVSVAKNSETILRLHESILPLMVRLHLLTTK